jgi:hypothetical protein
MSTTFGELKTRVSTVLQDPDLRTFTEDLVEELVQSALVEVGRIAPEQYYEDIDPTEGTLAYQLRYAPADLDVTIEADTDAIAYTGHGMTVGTRIKFTELTGGTGLSLYTTYYVIQDDLTDEEFVDAFKVSGTLNGSVVDVTVDYTATTSFRRLGSEDAMPEIEVVRVEVWDPTQSPDAYVMTVPQGAKQPIPGGDAGWSVWGGILTVPSRIASSMDEYLDQYIYRVWGYSPYISPVADADIITVSREVEQAMVWFIRLEAIDMLLGSRDLFTQWQTRSGNTDITPAQLMNQRSMAEQAWTRKSRAISRLRAEV